jgi:hypothetical protein
VSNIVARAPRVVQGRQEQIKGATLLHVHIGGGLKFANNHEMTFYVRRSYQKGNSMIQNCLRGDEPALSPISFVFI